ncbi:aromatic amino acid transport family protein [Endozoicomonas arenosclerae]|uniref:aromatic amino acid transport family protein n=1 Tax=Endozoicomonas arenosclerae TaxID=1633495 RepID=UPI0007841731|nr:aromatic amino acid transport family protein [Endozoicomonas arenosclerae]
MSEAVIGSLPAEKPEQEGSILGGTVIVAGTAIGAGMFSLPIATSGMWFGYSVALMLITWYCMYSSALYLLETNLRFPRGASFDTMAQATLGSAGRIVNGASVAFLCYILTYAYISGGSSIITYSLQSVAGISLTAGKASLIFAVVLAVIVVAGTRAVDRVTTALLGGMIITFLTSTGGLVSEAQSVKLFPGLNLAETVPYSLVALSFLAVSFGMQTAVPSLTKYYNRDGSRVRNALLWGSLLTLGIYVIWQIAIFGNIDRSEFPAIIAAGGNIGNIMGALADTGLDLKVSSLLQLFSNMAVASSFLGVALCLYDYISDLFGFDDSFSGRLKTATITFVPPTLLGVLLPNGFITAIGFAGLVMVIFCVLSPVLMAWIGRQKSNKGYQVPGGMPRMVLVFAFGVLAMTLAGMDAFGLLLAFGK